MDTAATKRDADLLVFANHVITLMDRVGALEGLDTEEEDDQEPVPDTENVVDETIYQYVGEPLHELLARLVADEDSQAEVARQCGIGKAYLSRLLSGVKHNPSDEVLNRMGIQRRTTIEYWFKDEKA
jgi:hypothetical protein